MLDDELLADIEGEQASDLWRLMRAAGEFRSTTRPAVIFRADVRGSQRFSYLARRSRFLVGCGRTSRTKPGGPSATGFRRRRAGPGLVRHRWLCSPRAPDQPGREPCAEPRSAHAPPVAGLFLRAACSPFRRVSPSHHDAVAARRRSVVAYHTRRGRLRSNTKREVVTGAGGGAGVAPPRSGVYW